MGLVLINKDDKSVVLVGAAKGTNQPKWPDDDLRYENKAPHWIFLNSSKGRRMYKVKKKEFPKLWELPLGNVERKPVQ